MKAKIDLIEKSLTITMNAEELRTLRNKYISNGTFFFYEIARTLSILECTESTNLEKIEKSLIATITSKNESAD